MSKSFIPDGDNAFNDWAVSFMAKLAEKSESFDIPAADFTALNALYAIWNAAWQAYLAPDHGKVKTLSKNEARKAFQTAVRSFVKTWLMYNNKVTNSDRANLGIPIHDNIRTKSTAPTTRPVAEVAYSPAQLIFHFKDEGAEKRAKPKGVTALEMAWDFCDDVTRITAVDQLNKSSRATAEFLKLTCAQGERGKQIVYFIRWIGATALLVGEWNGPGTAIFP
jgi:hypothetical protein